jgi:hypothetical protein
MSKEPKTFMSCATRFLLNTLWSYFVIYFLPSAAQGLTGGLNLNYSSSEQFEQPCETTDTFNKNFFLSIDKPITPLLL